MLGKIVNNKLGYNKLQGFLALNLVFVAIGWARGAIDGLVVIYLLSTALLLNYTARKRNGWGLFPDESNGTVSGVRELLAHLFFNSSNKGLRTHAHVIKRSMQVYFIGGLLLTTLLLHAYIALWVVFDWANPSLVTEWAAIINTPFEPLYPYWNGVSRLKSELLSHGYGSRVPIMIHVVIASAVGHFLWMLSVIWKFPVLIPQHRDYMQKIISGEIKFYRKIPSSVYPRALAAVIGLAVTSVMFLVTTVFVKFPGEHHSFRSAWLVGYGYKDNIAFFAPLLFHGAMSLGMITMLTGLVSMLYPSRKKGGN